MPLNSLSTTAETSILTAQIAAVYDYLATQIEVSMINVGLTVPAVERQNIPWAKTFSDGSFDAIYTYHNNNWYTRMPYQLNTISIIPSASPLGAGWITLANSTIGITFASGTEARQFTGTGLLVIGQWAYRRFDQPLTA